MRKIISLLVMMALIMSMSLTSFAETGIQKIDVGDHELNVEVSNPSDDVNKQMTIVFEAGYGDDMSSFDELFKALEGKARLIRYDRAGLGQSDDTTHRKTVDNQVASLEEIMSELNVEGKVIFVGHSIAGYNARVYAKRNDVAGVVLLDASHEDQHKAIYELEIPELWATYVSQFTVEGSYSDILESAELTRNSRDAFRNIPLVVISAKKEGIPSFGDIWNNLQDDVASLSDHSERHILDSGHYVHHDHTEFVTEQILELIEEVK